MFTLLWVLGVCAVVGWIDAACRQPPEWIDLTKRWAEPATATPPKAAKKTETAAQPKKRKVLKPISEPQANPLDVTFEWDGIT